MFCTLMKEGFWDEYPEVATFRFPKDKEMKKKGIVAIHSDWPMEISL